MVEQLVRRKQCRMVSGPQLLLSAGSSSVVLAQAGCQCKLTRKDGWRLQRIPRDAGATRSGSEPRREREPRPCGAAARADAISRKQRGLAASPMWRAVRADIDMASASVARRTRPFPRPGADAGWARRLERAES